MPVFPPRFDVASVAVSAAALASISRPLLIAPANPPLDPLLRTHGSILPRIAQALDAFRSRQLYAITARLDRGIREALPQSVVCIGQCALPQACIFAALGVETLLAYSGPRLLPDLDDDLHDELEKALSLRGVKLLNTPLPSVEVEANAVVVEFPGQMIRADAAWVGPDQAAIELLHQLIPQIAIAGATARELSGQPILSGRCNFADHAATQITGAEGFARLVCGPEGKLLGAAVIGEGADDLIAAPADALRAGASLSHFLEQPAQPLETGDVWRVAAYDCLARSGTLRTAAMEERH